MAMVVVEKVWDEPVTPDSLMEAAQGLIGCLGLRNARWIRSLIVDGGSRTICTFEAPDAESVRQSYREVGGSFTNIWTAEVLELSPER